MNLVSVRLINGYVPLPVKFTVRESFYQTKRTRQVSRRLRQSSAMRVTVYHKPRQCHWLFIRHYAWLRTQWQEKNLSLSYHNSSMINLDLKITCSDSSFLPSIYTSSPIITFCSAITSPGRASFVKCTSIDVTLYF